MKLTWIATTAIGVSAVMMSGKAAAPIVIWNASPSVPVGFYVVSPSLPQRGQLAVVRLAPGDRGQAYLQRYLHRSDLLLKLVAAVEGDRVCRLGAVVLVGQRIRAWARNVDAAGRPLPVWAGCHVLLSGEVFLLAPSGASFDGRYLGVTRAEQIVGTATRRARVSFAVQSLQTSGRRRQSSQ
jgi:type IV secretory pathway protease TraF